MRSPSLNEINEMDERSRVGEEALMRATLAERAGFEVESERDWRVVASRLRFEPAPARTGLKVEKAPASWIPGALGRVRPRTWPGAIMLIATCVALMGVGFATFEWAGPFVGQKLGLIGERRLYSTVNQSLNNAGITIKVDKAYADAGNVYIAFRIQPDQAVAGTFTPATFSLTDQYGEEGGGGNIQCAARADATAPQVCVLDSPPFHPPAGATSLVLTLDVQALYHISTEGGSQRIAGPWQFMFSVPFHTQSLGPGGPYAEPAGRISPEQPASVQI
jgi:hypothetical protein